ncbi:glutathione synthase (plasmid) [Trichlorobacter lovleyi]|uniref:glutathione synthase n=1 Tax=Trichlorobacter lovleyi TaxID=313985 RepID=UPI0022401B80|nr:glutathione synthase [Trichlorobacter lovleyi]QOX80947.1 glutathione synthase [Trichlorobacter lovleyi]
MTIKLGIVMDPISQINVKKDSSLAMLLEAKSRGYELYYMEMEDLYLLNGRAHATMKPLQVEQKSSDFYRLGQGLDAPLADLDVILMRKDPPFDTEFIYATYMLERAEAEGVLIVNNPRSLRDANEKLFTAWFSELTPETLVSRNPFKLRQFYAEHNDIILKPLDGMGGASIFHIKPGDRNLSVIIETLTQHGKRYAMAQKYIPEISDGDKRILVVNGEPIPYCLARIPANGETRGNLAAGGRGEARPLSETDWRIAKAVAPVLKEKGLYFVGLDVIGDKLTEINVTSPTCIREIEAAFDVNISGKMMDSIELGLASR